MIKKLSIIRQVLRFASLLLPYGGNPIRYIKYLPSSNSSSDYSLVYSPPRINSPLPVPPQELWLGYGSTASEYVDSGKQDVDKMISILSDVGFLINDNKSPILDLGCGGGRMIRHLNDFASQCEIWGMDISAPHINWLKMNLSPPFNFAVNTTIPHLPFSDNYFSLIYCGSLFTHVDDLAETWFLELKRLIKPEGVLFCTVHDEQTLETLSKQSFHPIYEVISKSLLSADHKQNPDILVCGQDSDSNVFYKNRYLNHILSRSFDIKAVVPSAYGYQTAYILSK
jgi:ubiquinone/menaquinone biosynthesis C-methylase UbiE